MKDWLYEKIVRGNEAVRQEYEEYVMDHIEEHETNRMKHWRVLLGLLWKYRKDDPEGGQICGEDPDSAFLQLKGRTEADPGQTEAEQRRSLPQSGAGQERG